MKKKRSLTSKNEKSGKTKGCSEQTEQPDSNASEQDSDTEKKVENCKEKRKHIMLPFQL